ncbi:MAG: peptidase S41 [Chitinophagaceae bacterium]|nr:peptidase S41 [Chitinophagaceae bacterium]
MKKIAAVCFMLSFCMANLSAQVDAGLFRYPDVSKTQIVFTYANDVWIIPKEGGTAIKLSSPSGVETFPKFSPDGKSIAFSGNYDGNTDVYMMPTTGGVPQRLTQHGGSDRVVDWTPDGKRVLFASGREAGRERFNQFFTIPANGGAAEKLPLAYGEFGSYSADGKQMALTFRTQVFRTWKRYRGGWNADIHIFNFTDLSSVNISSASDAADELPMWHGNSIYFLSDRGTEVRMNLWKYDISSKIFTQLTSYTDYDVHFPSFGDGEIVYEAGGKLYLYTISSGKSTEVKVNMVTDKASLKPATESVEKYIQHVNFSPDGNRVLIEARGDIFSVPSENGFIKNMTRTSGSAERYPSWSPDGSTIAYWSDQSGEYELWINDPSKEGSAKKISSFGTGFRYNLFWSPDSKKIAFIDKGMQIRVYDIATGETINVDKGMRMMHGPLEGFTCNWSPDSRWLTWHRDLENYHSAVFIYDLQSKKKTQVTSGYYNCFNPVFDSEGKYLYLLTRQNFQPTYSSIDNTFIYPNSAQPAVISLKNSTPALLSPKNDNVTIKKEENPADTTKKAVTTAPEKKSKTVEIDLDGFESRLTMLPVKPGNYANINSVKGKIIYQSFPNTGSPSGSKSMLKYFDIEKREEKNILEEVDRYWLSSDGKKILVQRPNTWAVIKPEENQKFEKPLRITEMSATIDPQQEWKQLFMDAWRIQRDYFYDKGMHGMDWNLVKDRYLKMLDGAMSREEVNFVLGEMIGELNASHTYRSGGDEEDTKNSPVGYLGVDWAAEGEFYKIKKIIKPAPWDAEVRSPLDQPGVEIKEGYYILAVNGVPVTTAKEPFAAFQGLSNKAVEITYNTSPSWTGAKTTVVQTMGDEARLRHLAWIESNRKRVEEASNGDVGYIYVPSTGVDGQNELMRQFNAQWDKKALVIDERFNSGGQIPDRFIEVLNRDPLAFWAIRDGETWPWPPYAHFGPKVMLANGWSGSGGDAFPDYFKKKKLGPVIGTRTWGGLIGISGTPPLIDGGSITAPSFRMYNPDGTWFKEGHGVDPDIEVPEDLTAMAKGKDPQIEKALAEIKELLKKKEFKRPPTPSMETRKGF